MFADTLEKRCLRNSGHIDLGRTMRLAFAANRLAGLAKLLRCRTAPMLFRFLMRTSARAPAPRAAASFYVWYGSPFFFASCCAIVWWRCSPSTSRSWLIIPCGSSKTNMADSKLTPCFARLIRFFFASQVRDDIPRHAVPLRESAPRGQIRSGTAFGAVLSHHFHDALGVGRPEIPARKQQLAGMAAHRLSAGAISRQARECGGEACRVAGRE